MTPSFVAFEVTAPGSIMITGEHAVVYGYPAIVRAIDQKITIRFEPRDDRYIEVNSEISSPIRALIDDLKIEGPLRYVLTCVDCFKSKLDHGISITIRSQIDPTLGLGSSAAVTIAMLCGLTALCREEHSADRFTLKLADRHAIHTTALGLVRRIQGRGSGADLAASLFGGMISYRLQPISQPGNRSGEKWDSAQIEPLPEPPEMSLRYCGYKTPTGVVLAKVAEAMAQDEERYNALYARMGDIAAETIIAAKSKKWRDFGTLLNRYQDLMKELGVCDEKLESMIAHAQRAPGILGTKISGSGLGDCIVSLGPTPPEHTRAPISRVGADIMVQEG